MTGKTTMTVELRNISKSYGFIAALSEINLTLEEGQFLTLLGPTGCGKTTLLRIIAGFVQPTSGDVLIGGQVINNVPPSQRQIGLLFQSYALFPHMTVEQNVGFGLRARGMDKAKAAAKVDAMLSLLGMGQQRAQYPAQLSGGQQQRTALARTLAIEPRLLLLDEPLAALDRKLKLEMQAELKKLIASLCITTICVSHDQDEALTMSDKIALLNQGRIEQFGAPLDLYDQPRSSFAAGFLGSSNLLTGDLRRGSDGRMSFESGAFRIAIHAPGLQQEHAVTLMLRPEHLLLKEDASPHALPGTIKFVTQFGSSIQYEVELDSGPVFLVAAPRGRGMISLARGSHVFLSLADPSAYRLIHNG